MVLSVAISTILFEQRSWNFLGPERPPLVPDSLYVTYFLEGTKLSLQCIPPSEHPTLLLMHLYRFAEYNSEGVRVDLKCFLPEANILSDDGVTLG